MATEVAFYSDALTSGRYGLGRYAWELFRELRRTQPELTVRPVSTHVALEENEASALKADYDHVKIPYGRKAIAGLWSSFGLPRIEHWIPAADVVHCVELDYRVATKKPLVVTIHDIGPLTHPEYFRASHPWLLRRALKFAAKRADSIICVSQATADAVETYLKCRLGDRLVVIPEGVSETFAKPVDKSCFAKTDGFIKGGQPFFLWAGSLNPRKNLKRMIEAFEQVAKEVPHHLIITGEIGWDSDDTLRTIQTSPLGARIHLSGRVTDDELRGLYQRAAGFIYVSLMEGFGLPILEAMASGCPVITSNCSSMPEVAGDAAYLVNPLEVDDIAGAMKCLATDSIFSQALAEKGRARAKCFRWDSCAASVAGIYQRVKQSKPARRLADATPESGSLGGTRIIYQSTRAKRSY